MANTNLYLDKILLEHPIAAWSLDDSLSLKTVFQYTSPIIKFGNSQNLYYLGGTSYGAQVFSNPMDFYPGDKVYVSIFLGSPYFFNVNSETRLINANSGYIEFDLPYVLPTTAIQSITVYKYDEAYTIDAYNTNKYPAYTMVRKPYPNTLTSSVPMVYGSGKSQNGTIIIPSFGLFGYWDSKNQFTFETWIKFKKSSDNFVHKLVGLMADNMYGSSDVPSGLYYSGTSLILRIGNKTKSAYVKETDKPMLIHITYAENLATVMLNGEEIISLNFEQSDINIMSYNSLSSFIMLQNATYDCPAIYPYKLSKVQAKMHYAYGQAVVTPETINKEYGGKTIEIDFASAGYSNSLNYPNNAEWKNSSSDNINIGKYSISNKQFDLPKFNFYDTATNTSLSIDSVISSMGSSWNHKNGSLSTANSNIEFGKIDLFDTKVKGFYADFYVLNQPTTSSEKIIFKIVNRYTKNYLKITMKQTANSDSIDINYWLKYNSTTETLISTQTNPYYKQTSPSTVYMFLVGLDIDKFSQKTSNDVKNFLSLPSELSLYAFGDNDISIDSTPNVYIKSINFLTQPQLDAVSSDLVDIGETSLIDSTGRFFCNLSIINGSGYQKTSGYQLKYIVDKRTLGTSYKYDDNAQNYYQYGAYTSKNYFTIATSGYWKSDVPLSHFATYTKDSGGNNVWTFNSLQFNVDYPYIESSYNKVKTYITFEPIDSTYKKESYFTSNVVAYNRTIIPNPSTYLTTKYQVFDGTVIYPPSGVDISTLKIVTHVYFDIDDTTYYNISIKSLEMASLTLSLNPSIKNSISTKHGYKITPYTYTSNDGGITKVYDYSGSGSAKNPFIIAKKTTPYLNLERLSGIRLVGKSASGVAANRGLSIDINESLQKVSRLNTISAFIYYDEILPTEELFHIVSKDKTISIASNSGVLYSDSSIASEPNNQNVKFYINGELSNSPTIRSNEWTHVTVTFTKPLIFDEFAGQLNITGQMAIDNISYYEFSNLKYLKNHVVGTWQNVLTPPTGSNYTWQQWTSSTWNDITIINNGYSDLIKPEKIYGMYTGTNILYPGVYSANKKINVHDVQYKFYSDYASSIYSYSAN